MKKEKVWCHFHNSEFEIPSEAMDEICQQGSNDEAVNYWVDEIALTIGRNEMIKGLREYGAWTLAELEAMPEIELEKKVLWVSAWDAKESHSRTKSGDSG